MRIVLLFCFTFSPCLMWAQESQFPIEKLEAALEEAPELKNNPRNVLSIISFLSTLRRFSRHLQDAPVSSFELDRSEVESFCRVCLDVSPFLVQQVIENLRGPQAASQRTQALRARRAMWNALDMVLTREEEDHLREAFPDIVLSIEKQFPMIRPYLYLAAALSSRDFHVTARSLGITEAELAKVIATLLSQKNADRAEFAHSSVMAFVLRELGRYFGAPLCRQVL